MSTENKCTIYKIKEKITRKMFNKYIKENFPEIKRGDAVDVGICLREWLERNASFMYWDGNKLINQCTDFYDYVGGGPPLSFKTFTEFPMNYFEDTCWFGDTVYLDYDTFAEQIRNLKPTRIDGDDSDDEEYDEECDECYELVISYKGKNYSLPLNEAEGNYSLKEYIEFIKTGKSQYVILVDTDNQIVDIDRNLVYNVDVAYDENDDN